MSLKIPAKTIAGLPRQAPDNLKDKDALLWTSKSGVRSWAKADSTATQLNLHEARLIRMPTKYPNRQNYQGHYWFSAVDDLIWHESMEEYAALMWLDYSSAVNAIAPQPMCLYFADGSRHVPDYFLRYSDGTQALYDVRPLNLVDEKFEVQVEHTREMCTRIGWDYSVFMGMDVVPQMNLEWLATYRDVWCEPSDVVARALNNFLRSPRRIADVAQYLDGANPSRHMHSIFNQIWHQSIVFDPHIPLNWDTIVRLPTGGFDFPAWFSSGVTR